MHGINHLHGERGAAGCRVAPGMLAPGRDAAAAAVQRHHFVALPVLPPSRRFTVTHNASEHSAAAPAAAAAASVEAEWIEVGVVGPPHGVRGEMKVQPLTDFPEDRLGTPGMRWLQPPAPKLGRARRPPPQQVELMWGRSSVSKVGHGAAAADA